MTIQYVHSKTAHRVAVRLVSSLVDADPKRGTPDADRLEVLGTLVQAYEARHYPIDLPVPLIRETT